MNVAIVTGASSGMGRECVRQLDRIFTDGIDELWIIARRKERLIALSKELHHKARILPYDLTSDKDLADFELSLDLAKPNVKMLVNASGYGIMGSFFSADLNEQAGMVRLNCEALTRVTYLTLKYMNKGARIIQFASSAAFLPQPDFAVYAASKSYVLSFSRALSEELRKQKISVTSVCPGPVETEFFKIAQKHGTNFNFKKYFICNEREVVRQALVDSYHRRDMSVYSFAMKSFYVLAKLIPHNIIFCILNLLR